MARKQAKKDGVKGFTVSLTKEELAKIEALQKHLQNKLLSQGIDIRVGRTDVFRAALMALLEKEGI